MELKAQSQTLLANVSALTRLVGGTRSVGEPTPTKPQTTEEENKPRPSVAKVAA